jgi:hypothetical protein
MRKAQSSAIEQAWQISRMQVSGRAARDDWRSTRLQICVIKAQMKAPAGRCGLCAELEQAMTENGRAVVVVGITGKRDLKGKDEAVRGTVRQALAELDTRFPDTPKTLLSALAEGADTIAAEEALARSSWQVVAPLPLRLELYLQDFTAAAAEHLRGLLKDPRVHMLELDPLLDPATGQALELSALSRRPEGSNENRSLHYEQVGLFIAQNCVLMLAVMPADEQPGRIGGTARIVDFRLRGRPDRHAHAVFERSAVLRKRILLDQEIPARCGWLILMRRRTDRRSCRAR